MEKYKEYVLDKDNIEIDFKFKETGLTHSQCNKLKLLPFSANEKTLFTDFTGVVGSFSRLLCDKELKENFNKEEFIDNIVSQIGEFQGDSSKAAFKDIIKEMFIDKGELVDFDIKTINYISSIQSEEKIARFIYSIFASDEIKEITKQHYDHHISNVMYKLVIKALPELKDSSEKGENYIQYMPFIKELFLNDFKFLISNEEFYRGSIKRFLEFYYLFYVSQLSFKLSQFEKADVSKPDTLYFSLNWESISKNRTTYIYGLENLRPKIESLFSHAITLEFLNHCNIEKPLGYVDLYNILNEVENRLDVEEAIEDLYDEYVRRRQDGITWSDFKPLMLNSGCLAFDKVYKLYKAVEYQFQGKTSTRTRANEAYKNWFIKFIQQNFGKRRGSLGYTLSLSEEDIILLTKLSIGNEEKIKLGTLFEEFEKRGVSFDRDSKSKIIQLYEKLNLLEKKSDSGDAQYVRSIL